MTDFNNCFGAKPATIAKINEIIRGATIKKIDEQKAQDPDHGGEIVRLILNGFDWLAFIASPNPDSIIIPGAPSAFIQPFLVTRRGTTLKPD